MSPDSTAKPREKLFKQLTNLGIPYKNHLHIPVFTVEEGEKLAIPGGRTKNLFLKDKNNQFFLLCALGETKIKLNQLHKKISCGRLSFGKPENLLSLLGVTPGSVTVFGLINDSKNQVHLLLDQALFEHEFLNVHPLTNTMTTTLSSKDLLKWINTTGAPFTLIDFTEI